MFLNCGNHIDHLKRRVSPLFLFIDLTAMFPKSVRFLFLIGSLIAIVNCFNPFAPKIDRTTDLSLVLTDQSTPDLALQNFIYAYTFKDSLSYSELLDSSFVFVFFDPNLGSSGRFVSWGRNVDLKTTGQLFRNFETITLTWNSTIYQILEENAAELAKTFQLDLFGSAGDFSISGNAIFNFKRSIKDDKWRITRWKDES